MDVAGFSQRCPRNVDPVLFAIPCFLLLLILEWTAARKLESIETALLPGSHATSGAYLTRDLVPASRMGLWFR